MSQWLQCLKTVHAILYVVFVMTCTPTCWNYLPGPSDWYKSLYKPYFQIIHHSLGFCSFEEQKAWHNIIFYCMPVIHLWWIYFLLFCRVRTFSTLDDAFVPIYSSFNIECGLVRAYSVLHSQIVLWHCNTAFNNGHDWEFFLLSSVIRPSWGTGRKWLHFESQCVIFLYVAIVCISMKVIVSPSMFSMHCIHDSHSLCILFIYSPNSKPSWTLLPWVISEQSLHMCALWLEQL